MNLRIIVCGEGLELSRGDVKAVKIVGTGGVGIVRGEKGSNITEPYSIIVSLCFTNRSG